MLDVRIRGAGKAVFVYFNHSHFSISHFLPLQVTDSSYINPYTCSSIGKRNKQENKCQMARPSFIW